MGARKWYPDPTASKCIKDSHASKLPKKLLWSTKTLSFVPTSGYRETKPEVMRHLNNKGIDHLKICVKPTQPRPWKKDYHAQRNPKVLIQHRYTGLAKRRRMCQRTYSLGALILTPVLLRTREGETKARNKRSET
ncbi:hypothetical protein T265_01808 [Opisthorchis viverrini]|uniref:Uncharacterized protein n=1 Tax=Opisthorchis viverrini TaxID=6198 RepID=A0A075A8H7_OPIVI|nr:hypothetical protein T265_01808 [Opisthorchis viverrini]KER32030.1 hypothetical protein T265_01808 [Opisthorchis viverrini]